MGYQQRIENLHRKLAELACEGMIVDDPVNLFYLTGLTLSAGQLLIHSKGACLFVDGRYQEMCRNALPFPVYLSPPTTLTSLLEKPEFSFLKTLTFSHDTTTYKSYIDLKRKLETLNEKLPKEHQVTLKPVESPVNELRQIKDSGELDLLRSAAKLGSEGYDYLLSLLREGITENELATELEIFWKRRGGKALAFDPIIAFGSHSSMPHYRTGKVALKKGDIVLLDIGVNFEHYHSDMTRAVFFGEPDPKLLTIYNIVKEAQEKALALCKPGTLIGDLDTAARKYIEDQGYGDNFTHSLGHGVGLEIHESPSIRNKPPYESLPLQAGMVLTIEPGIYLPGVGGVRLEDTVAITADGHENLTNRSTNLYSL